MLSLEVGFLSMHQVFLSAARTPQGLLLHLQPEAWTLAGPMGPVVLGGLHAHLDVAEQ